MVDGIGKEKASGDDGMNSINNLVDYDIQHVEEPYDDYEHALLQQIEMIKQAYQRQIEPIVKKLAESRSYKTPKMILRQKEQNNG